MTPTQTPYDLATCERLIATKNPIIIGGCGRSGTTLLLSMLSAHPRIWSIPWETNTFLLPGDGGPGLERDAHVDMIAAALYSSAIPTTCTRWCEKTPRNVRNFSHILDCYGSEARLLHIVRDGRDVVTSVHPRRPDQYWVTAARWIRDVSAGLEFRDHPQVHTLRYEDLVRDPLSVLRSVCAFVGEDYAPELDQYPVSAKVQTSYAWFKPAARVSTGSLQRWRRPEHARVVGALTADERAGALLHALGYMEN